MGKRQLVDWNKQSNIYNENIKYTSPERPQHLVYKQKKTDPDAFGPGRARRIANQPDPGIQ